MKHHGIEQIMTFDPGFDGFPGITACHEER
jgi:predicted nucleic acid-binding protein